MPGELELTWSSVPVTSWTRISFTLAGVAVVVPVLVAPFHAEKYVMFKVWTPPIRGVVVPATVRVSVEPESWYWVVTLFSSAKVRFVALGIAVILFADRSSRTISSRAARLFCCTSTRCEPKR